MCVECEDTEAAVKCDNCQDEFCELCYLWLHNKGKRKAHIKIELPQAKKRQQQKQDQKAAAKIAQPLPTPIDNTTNNITNGNGIPDEPKELNIDPDMLKLRDAVLADLEVIYCKARYHDFTSMIGPIFA